MKLFFTILFALVALSPAYAAEKRERSARIALRPHAEVAGALILLSDLVPDDAPDYVREEAARIPLGLAPQTGTTRVLAAASIAAAIERAGLPQEIFTVPDRVSARRAGRNLSGAEIWAAIQRYLATRPASTIRNVRSEDLQLDSGFSIPAAAKIEVTRVTFDRALRFAQFHLQVEGAENADPICVRARMPSQFASDPSPIANVLTFTRARLSPATKPQMLVSPKTIARLHLHSADSDMMLDARPLQPGALDQTIRVRLASSAKTLQARVVGKNALDASF
jgi:hypothetical protein